MSTPAISTLNMTLNVNEVDIVGTASQTSVYNEFDDFGLIVGLDRLPAEKSADYKHRLIDAFSNRANSTYLGMIYGITRELNLSTYKPFRLRPKTSSGSFVGANPVFQFDGPFLELWQDQNNNILEMEIDLFDQSGPAYTILELYNYINAHSTYFIADQLNTTYQFERSMTILNQTNVQTVTAAIQPTDRQTLDFPNTDGGAIMFNNLFCTDKVAFANMVSSVGAITNDGDYYINPYTGDITTEVIPTLGTIIKYNYIRYNKSYLIASPIIIHNMQNPNFERIMFEQEQADDGLYYNGVPTEFGADIINELLSVY